MDTWLEDINPYSNSNLNNPDIKTISMAWSIPKLAPKQNTITIPMQWTPSSKIKPTTFNPYTISLPTTDTRTYHPMDNSLQSTSETVSSETNSEKNPISKDRESISYPMVNPTMVSGKIMKCTAMENSSSPKTKSDIKGNSKMACSMALEQNIHMNKYHKDKQKLIKPLSGFIKEVGSNIKVGSKMTKGKDLEKPSLKMVSGLGTLRMDSPMDTVFGKLMMEKGLKVSGKMDAIGNQPD